MDRLDRNDSLALLRLLVHVERQVTSHALSVTRMALPPTKNDRQFDEAQKSIRAQATEALNLCLHACQTQGFVDQSLTKDDLRHLR